MTKTQTLPTSVHGPPHSHGQASWRLLSQVTSTSRDKLAFEMLLLFLLYLANSFLKL